MTLISKTEQSVAEARATVAVNDDDVQAGYDDVALGLNKAGGFLSFPPTASKGTLKWFASNNAANYNITHTNASFGQSTAFVVPDPVNAAGVHMVGAGAAPFVIGNVPVATTTAGVFADSGVPAINVQPLTVTVTLTAAEVLAAYATPQLLLASPGASKAYLVVAAAIITEVSTAFATGGIAIVQYGNTAHGAGLGALDTTTPAAEITAASSQVYSQYGLPTTTATPTANIKNLGLYFSNATGPFTMGTGSTVTIVLQYIVIPAV